MSDALLIEEIANLRKREKEAARIFREIQRLSGATQSDPEKAKREYLAAEKAVADWLANA